MRATLDDLIRDLKEISENKEPKIPYQLHAGLRMLLLYSNAERVVEFLEHYRDERLE